MKIKRSQIWQLKPNKLEEHRLKSKFIEYHILIREIISEDEIVTDLVHEVDEESYRKEIMWAAARHKREVLDSGHTFFFPGIAIITRGKKSAHYILENYDYYRQAEYLLNSPI